MPTGICQTCGATVRFEGIAGLCPRCGAILHLKKKTAAPSPTAQQSAPSRKSAKRTAPPPDLESLDDGSEESFEPSAGSTFKGPTDPVILYLSVGAGAVVVLFGLYIALSTMLSRPAAIAPPPPPPPAPTVTQVIAPPPPPVVTSFVPTTAPVRVAAPPTSRPAWASLVPAVPVLPAKPITDQLVEASIKKAIAYLKTQINGDQLINPDTSDMYFGSDALVIYSLLHASEAVSDSTLSISDPFMQSLLDRLKQYTMTGNLTTYCRALRASALAMHDRDVDSAQLNKDRKYLLDSEYNGAYTYTMPPKGSAPDDYSWDNSNAQYGVLGIWAAVQAGISAPDKYWKDVEKHWLDNQQKDGGWGYNRDHPQSTITMTCAGVTSLCITAEQLEIIASKGKRDAHPAMSTALLNALDWLAQGDHLTEFNKDNTGYSYYAVERAALATGYRWFGDHDWYRELGAQILKEQLDDGSWRTDCRETAFRLLFLSRGRQPIFMNKLRFDGDWNDRPRDVAKLTQFAAAQLEKPFAWGVADLSRNWWDWMETPYLFISTDAAPDFSDQDCQKLRAYTDAGGLIFLHNEYGSKEVDDFANSLVKRVYPEYPFKTLYANDPIYSTVFSMKVQPLLKAVGNGTRTFLVYSPADLTQDWVRYRAKDTRTSPARQLGLNLFVEAAGKSDFRNRLNSPYEEPPDFPPTGTVSVAQVSYDGPWNPEPKAYERFPRWFQKQTGLKLDVRPTPVLALSPTKTPLAVLTGNTAVNFGRMDLHLLHDFVANGGVLIIDSTGGSKAFDTAIHQSLLPRAFPEASLSDLTPNHPILAGNNPCMDPLPRPRLRNYASLVLNAKAPNVQIASIGKGAILVSDLDLTTALLDSGTYHILGYTPAYAQSLMKNVILWSLARYSP
jgi:hypothetical protein